MDNEFIISFESDHVKVLSNGYKDLEFATRVWTAVAEACHTHDCFKVLGIANSTSKMETMDGYEHARLWRELGIVGKFRVAWVELNPDAVEAAYFIETVLYNRGMPVRLFPTEGEAKEWLLSGNKS